jgi:oligopeptidase B
MKLVSHLRKLCSPAGLVSGLLILAMTMVPACSSNSKPKEEISNNMDQNSLPTPPRADKIKKELTFHNHKRIDDYYWLNQRDNPDVIHYLEAENNYLNAAMKHTEKLREKLFNEIIGRIKKADSTPPFLFNGYYYYTRYEKGSEYTFYCRKKNTTDETKATEATEEIMLDVNRMAEGHDFFNVAGVSVSPDNTMVAYAVDDIGRRKFTIFIKNLVTGEHLEDKIPMTTGYPVWANDNKTLFYTTKDETTLRSDKILKHRIGEPVEKDKIVYHEKDETFTVGISKSKSRKYLFIVSGQTLTAEYRYLDANKPDGDVIVFQPRQRGHEYQVDHINDKFYIRTNLKAPNFRLMETTADKTAAQYWKDVIPHRNDILLEEFELFNRFLVLKERKNAIPKLRIIQLKDMSDHYIEMAEEAYHVDIGRNPEADTDTLRFNYSSLTTPESIYNYHMTKKEKTLIKQEEIPGGYNPELYETKRIYATDRDRTVQIPITVVYKKGLKMYGDNPALLYGYGSYGLNIEPRFRREIISLLDRGFVFAIGHIRGSQQMGRQWYEDGKLLKKKNTFTDFIECAKHLIAQNYTNPGKLFIKGGSAGGLLIGAVLNIRPKLFKGAIAAVPFVDVVTTMLDEDIPLTTGEYDEWGDPRKKEYYDYMLSYSPYDNVEAKEYPALLVTTGLHDSQVQYWEPAKWVAKLREFKTDNNLLLLHTNMEAGHGGQSGRFKRHKETALEFAFILSQLGIQE